MAQGQERAAFGGKARPIQKIKYVFADARGARENLPWMVKVLKERGTEITVEVFDETGQQITLHSVDDIEAFLKGGEP